METGGIRLSLLGRAWFCWRWQTTSERRDVGGRNTRPAGDDRHAARLSRSAVSRAGWSRKALIVGATLILLTLAGCSADSDNELLRLGLPEAASDRSQYMGRLWIGTWIAAACVGLLTLSLILWSAIRYRSHTNRMPRQSRYNLPMEIMYTIAPFIIVGVLFYYTILAQNNLLRRNPPEPEVVIDVVGQKWSWTFNYKAANDPAVGQDVWNAGTINATPDLYLPVGKLVEFRLSSPDVIHSFWIPSFYYKLDVIPGRQNSFVATPTKEGVFRGKCAELCGTYHSAMLFNVHIVSEQEYRDYLKTLIAKGQIGEAKGPKNAEPTAGNQTNPQEVGER
jgi:cytochrome c oxidase subunit 2